MFLVKTIEKRDGEREITIGRRWGADRICPNVPDEGRASRGTRLVRVRKKQIRFDRPKGGFAPIRGWYYLLGHKITVTPPSVI